VNRSISLPGGVWQGNWQGISIFSFDDFPCCRRTGEGVDRDHRPPKRLLPGKLNQAEPTGLLLILETGARFC